MSPGRYRSIASSASGGRASATGSLSSTDPASIVVAGAPPNVSEPPAAASIAGPSTRSATCAAPISSGAAPYWLLSSTRTASPPMLVRTTWRTVWPAMRGTVPSGLSAASSSGAGSDTGPVAQVPIHLKSAVAAAGGGGEGGDVHAGASAKIAAAVANRRSSR